MNHTRLFSRPALVAALAVLTCTQALWAHDGDDMMLRDQQVPYDGKIYHHSSDGGIAGGGSDVTFPASGIELLSWIPVTQFDPANTSASTVEGYVSPSGREYAVIGLSGGTGFVEVTDPGNAAIVGFITGPNSLWKDVRVYGHFAYSVSEGGSGIQVMDMNQIDSGVVTFVGAFNTPAGTAASTHTMFINQDSGYLYRCGGGSTFGVRVYSLADPANPTYIGTVNPLRYTHECQVVNYTSGPYAGKEIIFCYSDSGSGGGNPGIDILDITNKLAPVMLHNAVPGTDYPNPKFSHQGWLTPDRHYIYVDDELDQQNPNGPYLTRIIDVSNLSAPVYVGTFDNGAGAIDHNLYTKGNLLFESNYRSGLRIFDATNPTSPVEIAYFDTYPPDNAAAFNGLWDNYPYLPSGIILGSDIEKGLFVWKLGPGELNFTYPKGRPDFLNPAGDSIQLSITDNGGTLDPKSATLWKDTGSGYNSSALVPQGGNLFSAVFPAIPCSSDVHYYLSAQTTDGITVRDPVGAPTTFYQATAALGQTVGFSDSFETDTGWVSGAPGDDATTGQWVRVDPVGTAAQPEDDHTPLGTMCWVTGQGVPGGGLGDADVDGGSTTLTSATFDATAGQQAAITYWRWYSNNMGSDPGNDTMPVLISNDNGAHWVQLELVSENAGAWVHKSFNISDFVTPSNQMKIRFIARDLGLGSIVEAGVDDVQVVYYQCTPGLPGDINGDGFVNSTDWLAVINSWGNCPTPPAACPADISPLPSGDGVVNASDLLMVINNWG